MRGVLVGQRPYFPDLVSASKAALMTLLESARVDLRDTGVDGVTVCSGFVKSEMTGCNNPRTMPFLMETPDCVAAMMRGIDARRRVVHFHWPLSYATKYGLAHLPDFAYDWLAAKLGSMRRMTPSAEGERRRAVLRRRPAWRLCYKP